MLLNAWFPSVQIGNDPAAIRDWAQAAEDLGYEYIEVPDHVFGATARNGWTPRYDAFAPFHETFTTMAYLAATTKTIKTIVRSFNFTTTPNWAGCETGSRSRPFKRW